VEAISSDFNDQLLRVLGTQRLMYMDYAKFDEIMNVTAEVFSTWDENMKDFTNVAREGESETCGVADAESLVSVRRSSSPSRSTLRTTSYRSASCTSVRSVARTSSCAS
jgi:dynein heavy chain 1